VRKGFAKRDEPVPKEWYELPVYYKTAAHNLLGPDADVHWPSFTQKFDFELELAAVVGRAGRDIKAAEAPWYRRWLPLIGVALIVLYCLLPFFWMVVSSLRRPTDQFDNSVIQRSVCARVTSGCRLSAA